MTTREYRNFSRTVRAEAGASGQSIPIEIQNTDAAPHIEGESWHYETRGGRHIYHPSAYSRRGWSNMVYYGSTRSIIVGRDWLFARGLLSVPSSRG